MPDALSQINTRATSQRQPARADQVQNNAGGFVFQIDPLTQLRRFLVLGTEGGTYYTSSPELTRDNAKIVFEFARTRGEELVATLLELSLAGRAPRQNPILFALAAAASSTDLATKRAAFAVLPQICRTGTQLFQFIGYAKNLRGWGPALRRAVANWYLVPEVDRVAYQVTKYRNREGWTHRDVLRLAHPKPEVSDLARRAMFDWICGRPTEQPLPQITHAYLRAQEISDVGGWVRLIGDNPGLTWEMLPDAALTEAKVWAALVQQGIPTGALLRQLPRLTRLGLLTPLSTTLRRVTDQLVDPATLKKARIHPINVLVALKTYEQGRSERGSSTWTPETRIVDALDAAFYAAFDAVVPAGKNTMLALDVSGSMDWGNISGLPITPMVGSAAMAMVTARTEPAHMITAFSHQLVPVTLSPRQRLDDTVKHLARIPMGGTDCALPMLQAIADNLPIDTFVVYTDNETWGGSIHPYQALRRYREKSGINARLVVVGMTATKFSIADPKDPGMLDVAGFDSAAPTLISDFSRGDV